MKRILAALLSVIGLAFAVDSASAFEQCDGSTISSSTAVPSANGWRAHFTIHMSRANDCEFFNMRVRGHPQLEVDGDGNHVELDLDLPADWDGTYLVQACIDDRPIETRCDSWSTYKTEFLIGANEQQFCNGYADRAVSAAIAAQQSNCGFESESGRWSTDPSGHRNWCLYQFQIAGGVADKLAAATNLVNEAVLVATSAVDKCQADAAAAQQVFAEQRAFEVQVTGKSVAQCQQSNATCEARALSLGLVNAPGYIATECAPYFQQCMSNAAAAQQALADQRAYETQVIGKTVAQCQQSNATCEARALSFGPVNSPGYIATECAPYFQICVSNATAAAAATADPPPAPVGNQAASTCGIAGTATVVIADPAVPTLNVRDKPAGTILTTIPRGSQVNVVGGCGVTVAAGIVAEGAGGQAPPPGWCAISAPVVGCVSEQFLMAGVQGGGAAPAAGLVANKPQTPPPPPEAEASPPVAETQAQAGGGGQAARLTQGANIRNGRGSKKTIVLESLPGGSIVNVLGCESGWCRLAMPQYPEAWVFQDFLAFDVARGPAAPPAVEVTVNLGGAEQGGGGVAPPAPPASGGNQTASTCGLPGGTATVVIADPNTNILNVRDKPAGNILTTIPKGSQVNIVGGCGVQIAAGIVAQGTGGQPPVPGWCAISAPVIGCVSEQFLAAGIVDGGGATPAPAAGIVADQPQEAAAPTFTGNWNAEAQGASFAFSITQNGKSVSGSYTGSDGTSGQINGKVRGNVLRFAWRQADGLTGAGKFALSGDGNSFSGSYTLSNNPDVADGSWNGWRQ